MDISWTLLFTLCLFGNLVTARKKHKRSLQAAHDDESPVKLKKTKQFVFQAMLKRPTKTKRHAPSELSADPILHRKVIRNFNADFFTDYDAPGTSHKTKHTDNSTSQKSRRQLAPGFLNIMRRSNSPQVMGGKSKRHASSLFKVNVVAKPVSSVDTPSATVFKRETKINRHVPLSRGVVTKVKWYPAVKAKRQAIPSPSAAHVFGDKRNYIKLQVSVPKKHKRSISIHDDDTTELRRTKRNLYRALLKKRRIGKRQVPTTFNIDMMGMPRSPISRPMVKGQVQVVNFQIKVAHDWRDEMYNASSPEFELLVGNIVDAFANELTADYNFHSSAVTKLRKSDRAHWILVDVATRFYKTESNPLHHLQGIISKGWVSGQRVDPEYFILLGVLNGNKDIQKIKFPQKLKLRLVPPHIQTSTTPPPEPEPEKVQKTLKFKEIRISIKLKQMYGMFLSDRKSPEFKELGGNLEQAIYKIFARDSFFLGTKTLGFRESPEGRCIAVVAIDFKNEEKYAIEKMQAMISGGDLAGMPVDDTYLIVNSLSEVRLNGTVNKGNKPPQTNPLVHQANPAENKDVSTAVPESSTYSYQAKTVTPINAITTAPPEARSNVTVSEAKLSPLNSNQTAGVEAPLNSNQTAQQSPPALPQVGKAPVVKVVDAGVLSAQNATSNVIPETSSQVQEVPMKLDNATLVSPTFKPAVENQAVVNANATAPEDNHHEIQYLITSPGVVVAELPLHNESNAAIPPPGVIEEVDEGSPQSVPVKLIKGAKIVNETSEPSNVVQVPLIPLAALTGNPSDLNSSATALTTNASQIVENAGNFLPAVAPQNVTSPPGALLNTTTGQIYVPNVPPVIPIQPVAPVSNQPESTEATSKVSGNLAPPLAALTPLANLSTYPGLLPASVPLQAAPMANLTIPVNVNIVPPPSTVDITAHLLQPAEAAPLTNTTSGGSVANATSAAEPPASEITNTSNAGVPLADVSQPNDIAIVKASEEPTNNDVENRASAPSQTPALFPQPMTSKVTPSDTTNETVVIENLSPVASLLPPSNVPVVTTAPEVSASVNVTAPATPPITKEVVTDSIPANPVTASPNAPFKRPTVNQIIGSLVNSTSGVPAVNEAPVTSNVISVPENIQVVTPAAPIAENTASEVTVAPSAQKTVEAKPAEIPTIGSIAEDATAETVAAILKNATAPVTKVEETVPATVENVTSPVAQVKEPAPVVLEIKEAAPTILENGTAPVAGPGPVTPIAEQPVVESEASSSAIPANISAPPTLINAPSSVASIKTPLPAVPVETATTAASVNGPTTAQPVGAPLALEYAVPVPYRRPSVSDVINSLNGTSTSTNTPVITVEQVETSAPITSPPVPKTDQPVGAPLALENAVPVPYRRPNVNDVINSLNGTSTSTNTPVITVEQVQTSAPITSPPVPKTDQPVGAPLAIEYAVPVPYRRPSVNDIINSLNGTSTSTSAPVVPQEATPITEATPTQQSNAQTVANIALPRLDEAIATNISAFAETTTPPAPSLPPNPSITEITNQPLLEKSVSAPLQYKSVIFAIRVIAPWSDQLLINDSVPYVELSALIEQEIDNVLTAKDPFYVDVGVQEFLKDPEQMTIAHIMVRFLPEELHPVEVTKNAIIQSNFSQVTLDKDFFFVLSPDKDSTPEAMRNETLQNAATYLERKQKPKPLIFKEIRFSIRLMEPWNISYEDNNTMAYAVFSGMVEQAVDRALMSDSNYIDSTVLEMEKDQGNNTIVFVAVRFRIQEQDLEKKVVTLVQSGSMSGLPIDKNFFEVFSLSETHHPKLGVHMKPPDEVPLLSLAEELIAGVAEGQKQSATNDGVKLKESNQPVADVASPSPPPLTIPVAMNVTMPVTGQPLFTSGGNGQPLDDDVIPTATAPPNKVQSVASERVVTMAPSMHMMATKTETPPAVADVTDGLPTEAPYVTTPLPQGSSSNIATEMPGGTPLEHIEGSMTLQQTWHPFLMDKKSNEYKLLEETVISEIKNLYLHTINEEVIPQVMGFTETATPSTSTHNSNDTEITVNFKVMFLPGHESNPGPLEAAVKTNSLGDLVLYPTSFVLITANASMPSLPNAVKYTSCQSLHMTAVSAADGQIGGFIPECTPDGAFKPVQCHALTGFCWCVNHIGVRIVGTEERYKEPSCEGINLSGDITLPPSAPSPLPPGSCLVIQTKSWNPGFPIIGNMTVMEPDIVNNTMSYEMHIPDLDPGTYILRCILHTYKCDLAEDAPKGGDFYQEKKYEVGPDTTDVEENLDLVEQAAQTHDVKVPSTAAETAPLASVAPANQQEPTISAPPLSPEVKADAVSAPLQVAAPAVLPPPPGLVINDTATATAPVVANATSTSSDGEFDYQFTLLTNPNYVDPANRTEENRYMLQTGTMSGNSTSSAVTNTSDPQFIALPNGLPKSCQGIRDSGIGDLDGQYIIEARPGCHISVICVNMKDGGEQTKEFLGGPSEAEWKYWHYAVLIKISESDKRNIPQGACLEFSDQGKALLQRIMIAGAREGSPISKWKTKISNIIRKKRNLPKKVSIITKPKLIRINKEQHNKMWTSK